MLFFWKKKRKQYTGLSEANMSIKLLKRFAILLFILISHTFIIQHFENMNFVDSFWLSVTSITTVGYGDFSATSIGGRTATIVLIYIVGIWLLAQLAGDFIEYRADKRDKMIKGLWRWKGMSDHILIINTPSAGGDRYLIRLIEQIKQTPEIDTLPIKIATHSYPNGLPNELRSMGVVHHHIDVSSTVHIDDLNIANASYIILLCQDENDVRSDSLTLDMLDRIGHEAKPPFIIAECILDANRERFQRLGANAVIRPIRSYPELIVRSLSAPGTERVLENLFTHDGTSTKRFDIQLQNIQWQHIACKIISAGLGTPLGFIAADGQVITNPNHDTAVNSQALLIMVGDNKHVSADMINTVLTS